MGVKKQPDPEAGKIPEVVDDWFRQFIKHLELYLVETGQELPPDAKSTDCGLAALRAVRLTLRDSGLDDDQVAGLLARAALEDSSANEELEWNADLNRRRFELIDGDIQGTLSHAEQLELAGLTQLMREHVDSEANLPLEGAKKLHRLLTDPDSGSTDSKQ